MTNPLTTGNETIVPAQPWYGSRAQWVRVLAALASIIGAVIQGIQSYQVQGGGAEVTGHGGAAAGFLAFAVHMMSTFFDREKTNKVAAAQLTVATGAPLPKDKP